MIVFVNGELVPAEKAVVSVFDRGFLYGDGVFEAMRVVRGQPWQWAQHFARLQHGAEMLKLRVPWASDELRRFAGQLVERNQMPDALLRLVLSRGVGARGYSPRGADFPTLVMSLHPAPPLDEANPPQWRLVTAALRVAANDPLATIKTCNKLPQILARAEAEARGADESVLLNTGGEISETSSGNLFWIEDETVCTPPLASSALAGVTRATLLQLCPALGVRAVEKSTRPESIARAEGVFVSLTSRGVVEAVELDGAALRRSPLTARLRSAWVELIRRECGA